MTEPEVLLLARDLGNCSHGMRIIVAEWMLANGWTDPLDDAGTINAGRIPMGDDLSAALAECTAAIPDEDDWSFPLLWVGGTTHDPRSTGCKVSPPGDRGELTMYAHGPTLATALRRMASRLRARDFRPGIPGDRDPNLLIERMADALRWIREYCGPDGPATRTFDEVERRAAAPFAVVSGEKGNAPPPPPPPDRG